MKFTGQMNKFEFGKNWKSYSSLVNESRIEEAELSLKSLVGDIKGKSFLDIGCGSGLLSLCAVRLGASRVVSFDFDANSVEASRSLKKIYFPSFDDWTIGVGDVLNQSYLNSLGTFDVVYSWGVLHHTGEMWKAIDNIARLVNKGGVLSIAIYNDQGLQSKIWKAVKYTYNILPGTIKPIYYLPIIATLEAVAFLKRTISKNKKNPGRGMSRWHDWIDWLGGYPFEVAEPKQIVNLLVQKGFAVKKVIDVGKRWGNNEFVLLKS